MTVTAEQISKVKAAGFQNVEAIARACDWTGCPFYLAVAMIQKETKGVNRYGHDKGGALTGFDGPVSEGSYAVFRWMVDEGVPIEQPDGTVKVVKFHSNGVGPAQLTYGGFFTDMAKQGLKPWLPIDSVFYGVRLLFDYYKHARSIGDGVRDSIRYAGKQYNNSSAYGDSLLEIALEWKAKLGGADYAG